jgi:hypothetical protein
VEWGSKTAAQRAVREEKVKRALAEGQAAAWEAHEDRQNKKTKATKPQEASGGSATDANGSSAVGSPSVRQMRATAGPSARRPD